MFLIKLSFALLILALVLGACTAKSDQTPAGIHTEAPQRRFTSESPPLVVTQIATPTRPPSLTPTAQPSPDKPTPTRTQTELPPPEQPQPTDTQIKPTSTQEPPPPPASTEPPIDPDTPGTISGKVCHPNDESRRLTAYFENVGTFKLTVLPITKDQSRYTVEVEPGQYFVYAYQNRTNAPGGLYSEAVPCGLTDGCTDHNPKVFTVKAGQSLNGIDLCDWSAPESVPPNPAPVDPRLAGMVYVINDVNYFRYEEGGKARFLMSTPFILKVSPDGKRGIFRDDEKNDLFIVDFSSGVVFNLTNTPQVYESAYAWESGLPKTIIFKALQPGEESVPFAPGGLFSINMNGSQVAALDVEHSASNFDISQDGQSIAYGGGENGWIYKKGAGVSRFDPREYSGSVPEDLLIASPSWSPNGKRIAWLVWGSFSEQYHEGIGIFDREAKTFQLIHPVPGDGRGPGVPPSGRWSPDGKWLAITPYELDLDRRGIWLVDVKNPEKEIFIGASTWLPLWRPDGKWLAYYKEGRNPVWLYNPETGEHEMTALPPEARVVDW